MASQVTLVYTANAFGQTPAQLQAALAAIPFDTQLLSILGVTVASDGTVAGASNAVRTVVINLTPAFKALIPDTGDQRAPFWSIMTGILAFGIKSPILAAAPVLS